MKRTITITFFNLLAFFLNAQYQTIPNLKSEKYFLNPIFAGDHPRPKYSSRW
jgi:hypothetical protein